jgi:hypothetical protein
LPCGNVAVVVEAKMLFSCAVLMTGREAIGRMMGKGI